MPPRSAPRSGDGPPALGPDFSGSKSICSRSPADRSVAAARHIEQSIAAFRSELKNPHAITEAMPRAIESIENEIRSLSRASMIRAEWNR